MGHTLMARCPRALRPPGGSRGTGGALRLGQSWVEQCSLLSEGRDLVGERLLYGERACRTNLLQQVAAELAFLWGEGTG